MKKRKISESLIRELNSLQNTRNTLEEFLQNFISNSSRYVIFMHDILAKNASKDYIMVPVSQYIASLITCWETYFRDMFVYLASTDEQFLRDVIRHNNINVEEDDLIRNELSIGEFVSKFFNFQNLEDTENAFSPLYEGNSFFKALSEYELPFVLFRKGIVTHISLIELDQNWYELINTLFNIRHNIVHDANYRLELTSDFISRAESICIVLPQIVGQFVSEKYGVERPVVDIEHGTIKKIVSGDVDKKFGYVFTVQDMIAKDWIIKD
ncbi:hypothetical protein [Cohnella candidum]|uniref:RiboL-PSP-HEPN domain-containing protein n=1 Tax=Cohnella candidum TaxID=2674991 RepID=A0A3G3JV89_9BACL|nr:hypothetical protein [Cohnella candidum]AYQ72094.1 hypothetical protein EAV92_05625 [Cohnella candidum]